MFKIKDLARFFITKTHLKVNQYANLFQKKLEAFLNYIKDHYALKEDDLMAQTPVVIGLAVVGIFLGIFGTWATLAPIQSSAIASGQLVLDFNRKTVQHLEGGIVQKIWVKEGQFVQKGDALFTLKDIPVRAQETLIKNQLINARILESRLKAELSNDDIFDEEDVIGIHKTSENVQWFDTQIFLFESRKKELLTRKNIFQKQDLQLKSQLNGLNDQKEASLKQLRLLEYELSIVEELLKTKNVPMIRQLELEKQIAQTQGLIGDLDAQIAANQEQQLSLELEAIQLEITFKKEALESLQSVEIQISDLKEQFKSALDVLDRTVVRAPISGLVMNIKYHSIGAVLQPGADILNIVPQDQDVVVEARLKIEDIDSVTKGLKSKVQLSAYKSKLVPKISGEVISVSADSMIDELTGMPYYLARIRLSKQDLSNLKSTIKLTPGMPAQVFIMTGARTLFDYLFSPIIDASYKAFREQ